MIGRMLHKAEVIVITGASAGVARPTARAFARAGARIALLARGLDGLEGARKQVEEAGAQLWCCRCTLLTRKKSKLRQRQ
jgi:NADP-dependent 3-hydroxy acid dehydrogenase YdfG